VELETNRSPARRRVIQRPHRALTRATRRSHVLIETAKLNSVTVRGECAVTRLTRRQNQFERQTIGIDKGVNLKHIDAKFKIA
jgi:hypothetical protein